jgi:hypothetical protein
MKYIITIGLMFLMISCSAQENGFKKYVGQLQPVTMPISFRSLKFPDKHINNTFDQVLFKKYKPIAAYTVYGKLYEDEKSVAIIYTVIGDVNSPILMTYNKMGNKIDSLNLFEGESVFHFESETSKYVTIFSDKRIQVIDSVTTWKMEDNGEDRIEGTGKVSRIDKISYQLDLDGKIRKQKE